MTSSSTETTMSIGTVARRCGVEVSALRYYESVGLIPPPKRAGGKRVYDGSVFDAIALVQLAQDAGFTLAEIRALVAGFDSATPASERWQVMAREKLVEIGARIERLQRMQDVLTRLLRCRCRTLDECVSSRREALMNATGGQTTTGLTRPRRAGKSMKVAES